MTEEYVEIITNKTLKIIQNIIDVSSPFQVLFSPKYSIITIQCLNNGVLAFLFSLTTFKVMRQLTDNYVCICDKILHMAFSIYLKSNWHFMSHKLLLYMPVYIYISIHAYSQLQSNITKQM